MQIDLSKHLLLGVKFSPSAHHNERPADTEVVMIVVHGISLPPGEFGGTAVEDFFCGKLDAERHPYYKEIAHLRVAAHLFIKRCGETIQFVPFNQRAWHAGESQFGGRSNCNDYSIGIELEGSDDVPYTAAQYQELSRVVHILRQAYPHISPANVVGHSDIAPGRKTDPGRHFDWAYFKSLLPHFFYA
jgi:AmpD protein